MAVFHEGEYTRVQILDPEILNLVQPRERRIEERLSLIIDAQPHPNILLDMRHVRTICSAMLGALVSLNRRARDKGGRLRLVNLLPPVRDEMLVCRLERILDLEPEY